MKRTHGESLCGSNTVEYRAWCRMRARCNNPKQRDYRYYGARGIKVCERWNDYRNFLADMGRRPSPKLSLDRIDNDGHYEPGNCRWTTQSEQVRNQRHRPYIKVKCYIKYAGNTEWL